MDSRKLARTVVFIGIAGIIASHAWWASLLQHGDSAARQQQPIARHPLGCLLFTSDSVRTSQSGCEGHRSSRIQSARVVAVDRHPPDRHRAGRTQQAHGTVSGDAGRRTKAADCAGSSRFMHGRAIFPGRSFGLRLAGLLFFRGIVKLTTGLDCRHSPAEACRGEVSSRRYRWPTLYFSTKELVRSWWRSACSRVSWQHRLRLRCISSPSLRSLRTALRSPIRGADGKCR